MSQDQSVGNSAASPSAQSRTPSVRGYRMDSGNIPQEIRSNVAAQLGPEADVFPAKENGSYKGPVIHADTGYVVQAVGKDHQTAVVHQRADVQMMGAALQSRDARNDLINRNLQVHYRGDQAKAYPWDAEKEATQRTARSTDRPADRGAVAGQVLSEAEKYAMANIKNAKQREAFLKHLGNVTQQFQQPAQDQTRNVVRNEPNKAAQRVPQQQPAQDIER